MQKTKIVVTLIGVVTIFFAGYQFAANRYERDIAEARTEYAMKAQTLEEKYREKDRENTKKQAELTNALVRARADNDVLRDNTVRMQYDLDKANRRLSDRADRAGDTCSKRLAESLEIIRRYDEIASRGLELPQDVAVKKDAVVKLVK